MKKILALAISIFALDTSATAASPEDSFPSRPVRIVVPYPAGGLLDVSIRAVAAKLSEEWKQPVILDNRPGANEAIGADIVAKAPADGYTLFGCSEAALLLNPLLYKKLSYDPEKDFVPVSQMFQVPMAVSVLSSSKAKTIEEFVEIARSRGQQPMNFGSSGVPSYLPLAMLTKDQNLNMTHIPYNGAPPMIQDFLGGRLDTVLLTTSLAELTSRPGLSEC